MAEPNLLMEPRLTGDLRAGESLDLTPNLLADIGWDECPDSDVRTTVIFGDCDTGIENFAFDDGCTLSDRLRDCAPGARNHGAWVSCVARRTRDLVRDGLLDREQAGKITSCAARDRVRSGKQGRSGGGAVPAGTVSGRKVVEGGVTAPDRRSGE